MTTGGAPGTALGRRQYLRDPKGQEDLAKGRVLGAEGATLAGGLAVSSPEVQAAAAARGRLPRSVFLPSRSS